jgi:hypothetical protein
MSSFAGSSHLQRISQLKTTPLLRAPISVLLVAAIKLGDLGHPCKVLPLHVQWSERLSEEFLLQGDREKYEGLPVSFLCDRATANLPKSQLGFLEFMVYPLVDAVTASLPDEAQFLAERPRACHAHWSNVVAAAERKASQADSV